MAVMLMVAVTPVASGDSEATSFDSWACKITVKGTELTTTYSKAGGAFQSMDPVVGTSKDAGSWGYDEDGYGPFGSFYAAFDPANGNRMVCHLDPSDLTKSTDGTDISGKNYNIMWCLPKIYISVDGSTITLASDTSYKGTLAPAFTLIDDDGVSTSYNYLALGVYEATYVNSKLGSVSGTSPQNSTSLADYREEAKANTMIDGSVALLWNFHQYQLYRLCSLAVMENFDSQGQVGYGNCSGSYFSQTGNMDVGGPYQGTSGHSDKGAKLFIENAWGSLWEYVDDTVWWNDSDGVGLWAGQNVNPKYEWKSNGDKTYYTSGKDHVYPYGIYGYGADPSTEKDCWGLPTAVSDHWDVAAPDHISGSYFGSVLFVGGRWDTGNDAGLSCLSYNGGSSDYSGGSRLASLFDADSPPKLSVKYMDDGTEIKSDSVQKGQAYTISGPMSTKGGFTFVGWSDGTEVYHPGDSITVEKSITLVAVWTESSSGDKADPIIPIIPIIPDDGVDAIEVVVEEKEGSVSGIDGKSILLIAIIVAIIAELAVLCISRKR